MFTSLLGPLPLCAVAGVYFDPDVYSVNEGGTVTLTLRTNVTVNKRFSVLVNTRDDSANSKYILTITLLQATLDMESFSDIFQLLDGRLLTCCPFNVYSQSFSCILNLGLVMPFA